MTDAVRSPVCSPRVEALWRARGAGRCFAIGEPRRDGRPDRPVRLGQVDAATRPHRPDRAGQRTGAHRGLRRCRPARRPGQRQDPRHPPAHRFHLPAVQPGPPPDPLSERGHGLARPAEPGGGNSRPVAGGDQSLRPWPPWPASASPIMPASAPRPSPAASSSSEAAIARALVQKGQDRAGRRAGRLARPGRPRTQGDGEPARPQQGRRPDGDHHPPPRRTRDQILRCTRWWR